MFASVSGRDEDVDEHGHEQQADGEGAKSVKEGGYSTGFGVDVEEPEDEGKQVAGEKNHGEQQSHHGSVGFAGQTAVAVSGRCDHTASNHAVEQSDGEEIEGCIGQRRAVVVRPANAGEGVKCRWVVVVPAAEETQQSSEHEPEHTEVHPRSSAASVSVIEDVDQARRILLQDEQTDGFQSTTDGTDTLDERLREEEEESDQKTAGDENHVHASHLHHSARTSPTKVATMAPIPTRKPIR